MSVALARQLAAMLGSDAGVGWAETRGTEGLYPEETRAIARAVPKRQAEFAAGRRAARDALAAIGLPATPIPVGKNREPLWPAGAAGAITHDAGLALSCVVAARDGIGVDLTEAMPLPGKTCRHILPHADETGLAPLAARAGFSAKESLFKALFPVVRGYFGFSAACVAPDLDRGCFEVRLMEALGPFAAGARWHGHIAIQDRRLMTALRLHGLT